MDIDRGELKREHIISGIVSIRRDLITYLERVPNDKRYNTAPEGPTIGSSWKWYRFYFDNDVSGCLYSFLNFIICFSTYKT